MNQYTVLVCDDDRDIVSGLRLHLESENYNVLEAFNGRQALSILEKNTVHIVLMDVMMPGLSGVETLVEMRKKGMNVPVILLTAKSEDSDKILGLNCGADDYVTKPYNVIEVMARVRSHLRRVQLSATPVAESEDVIHIGGIKLDNRSKVVLLDGAPVNLTPTEFKILRHLMAHAGQVFTLADIYSAVWGGDPLGAENTVAVHIRHLREKIEIDPSNPRYLLVRWGQGYKFNKE